MFKTRTRLALAVFWLILIVFVTLTPGEQLPKSPDIIGFDKLVHFGMFMVLTLLWLSVYPQDRGGISLAKIVTNYLVFGIVFAIFVEYMQHYIPGRSFDYGDMAANLTGGTVGVIGYYILLKKKCNLV